MDLPKSGWKGIKQNWSKDLFAGFVVSLIALPLSLGLAIASGVPPIAGIITAVIGGIVVSILGGSYVTISGMGNGLAVATASAMAVLGATNPEESFVYVLAAVIISGGLIFTFGVFRFGSLSNFFPSAAVEGMLAAIGLIIMSKQLHIMLGELHPEGDTALELLISFPQTVAAVFQSGHWLIPSVGVLSLLIMIFYSKIRAKFFHTIPAPMWVVLLSIGLSYILEWQGNAHHIPKELLIEIPDDLIGNYQLPNFKLIGTFAFWDAVIILTLIASVESLLSIKGVERLDVFKRRANTDKDLKAHGIATVISGFLGGMNVVAVIARSSVNVNNGAVTRASNFFHGIIIALAVLFLDDLITRIPLPALSAILVYTGYKLASPNNILKIAGIGWESLTVYFTTLIATLVAGIIPGIIVGILGAFVLQIFTKGNTGLVFRNMLRPNTLMYQEENGAFLLSVKKYANFLNFNRMRKKLDSIPTGSHVIIDFSLCRFVDETVMEHLHNYNELYERKGGHIEIIGLDDLQSQSNHPFAPWVAIDVNSRKKSKVLTRRQKSLRNYMTEIGWVLDVQPKYGDYKLYQFEYFKTKGVDVIRNNAMGHIHEQQLELLDLEYHEGEFIARESLRATVLVIHKIKDLPHFILDKENLFGRIASVAGFNDINFAKHKDFSNRYHLKGKHPDKVRKFFTDKLILFFEENPYFHVESSNGMLLIIEKERLLSLSETKLMVSFAIRLTNLIHKINKDH